MDRAKSSNVYEGVAGERVYSHSELGLKENALKTGSAVLARFEQGVRPRFGEEILIDGGAGRIYTASAGRFGSGGKQYLHIGAQR